MSSLDQHDRLTIPLPNGTEVTTRVDLAVEDRVVPQGSIGRVVETRADRVKVRIVGVGELTYLRSQLLPRNSGQFRFAVRRDRAWQSLRECEVLETVVGSRAWGLADEGSDTDRRGGVSVPDPFEGLASHLQQG